MSTSATLCRGPAGMGSRFQHLRAAHSSLACSRTAQARNLPAACVRGKYGRPKSGAVCSVGAHSLASEQAGASPERMPILGKVWSACSFLVNIAKACVFLLLLSCAFAVPAFASAITASAPVSVKTRWHEISTIMANAMFTPQGQVLYSVLLGFMCVGLVAIAAGGIAVDRKAAQREAEVSDRVVASVLAQSNERTSQWSNQSSNRSSLTAASVGGTLAVTAAASVGSTTAKREQSSSRTSSAPFDARESVSGPRSFLQEKPLAAQESVVQEAQPLLQEKPLPAQESVVQKAQPQQVVQSTSKAIEEPRTIAQSNALEGRKRVQELEAVVYSFDESAEQSYQGSGVTYQASTAAGAYAPPAQPAVNATGGATGSSSGVSAPGAAASGASGAALAAAAAVAAPPRMEVLRFGDAKVQAPPQESQWHGSVDEDFLDEDLIEGPPRGQASFEDVLDVAAPPREHLHAQDAQTREFLDGAKNPAIPIIFVAALITNAVDKMKPIGNVIASGVFGAKTVQDSAAVASDRNAGRVLSASARGAAVPPFQMASKAQAQIDPWYLAAPMANLLTAEKRRAGPIQASTVRHKADPVAAIRDIQVPTAKHDWDPVTHISSINPPTDTSRYDPWVQIHRVQPPTIRHPADPLAHLSSIEVPTQRYGADPIAHIRDIQEPTARHGADPLAHIWQIDVPTDRFAADPLVAILDMQVPSDLHKADPLAHIRNIEVPTIRHGADPLAHISGIDVPTVRHKADPIAHISNVDVPTARHGADPLAHISNISAPTVRHHADPLTHISNINAPTVRHAADPLAHISSISAPQGDDNDPLRSLFRIDRPVENPAWDPVTQIGGVTRPDWRPMWDPMTAIPDMKRSTSKPFWDPLSFISSLQPTGSTSFFANLRPPTGKAWFDPLARLSAIQAPDTSSVDRPGLDMFKGIVRAALEYKSKPAQQQKQRASTALRYPTPYDVVEGRGVSRNADVGTDKVGPATFEPELPIVSRDDEGARVLGTSFVRSNVDSK